MLRLSENYLLLEELVEDLTQTLVEGTSLVNHIRHLVV
jgi:hypothetical protein